MRTTATSAPQAHQGDQGSMSGCPQALRLSRHLLWIPLVAAIFSVSFRPCSAGRAAADDVFLTSSSSSSSTPSSSHLRQHLSRRAQQQQLLGGTHNAAGSRQLHQAGVCPVGCLDGWCAEDAARGGLRCLKCEDTLIVDRATGLCGCPAGKYTPDGTRSCVDCPKSSYCLGGTLTQSTVPAAVPCPSGMTTLGKRSPAASSCVNLPGNAYTVDALGVPGILRCPVNTYNPGMRRQRTCWPCPAGYTTNGATGAIDISACVVPAGSYMQYPTIIALCPEGQYKGSVGPDSTCSSCPEGVTTPEKGSTSVAACTRLLPGYYAAAMTGAQVTSARPCPQKYFCPGGQPLGVFDPLNPAGRNTQDNTTQPCPNGTWTQGMQATQSLQCLTPPGHFTAGGTTSKCAAGSFRNGWVSASEAASCTQCGTGVSAIEDASILSYNPTPPYSTTSIGVTTQSSSCYIKPGQGMYYTATTGSWRARNCVNNNWGVNETTYNQQVRNCRACPLNMVTSTDSAAYPNSASSYVDNGDGRTSGFVSKFACVTQPGYGFDGRWSFPCPLGKYNAGDNWSDCSTCGPGLTTIAPGAGITPANCGIAPGYGFHNAAVVACPVGYYNNRTIDYSRSAPCIQCPTGTTTDGTGKASPNDCNLCIPGYGETACATQCGGVGVNGTYGAGFRALSTPCADCSGTNLTYTVGGLPETFLAEPTSRIGADTSLDCLSLWVTYGDSWSLSEGANASVQTYGSATTPTLSACLQLCQSTIDCQFATWVSSPSIECRLRFRRSSMYAGAELIAFKTAAAGNASQPSTFYVQYQDANGLTVGTQTPAPNASSFTSYADCFAACDAQADCAGVTAQQLLNVSQRPSTCHLITGVNDSGSIPRTFALADATRLQLPVMV